MNELNYIIGNNLKNIRKEKNLSLDEVASVSGVSKPMLGQIERGKSNPTVSTLWKISTGLKVPFSEFMKVEDVEYELVSFNKVKPVLECEGSMKIYPLFPFNPKTNFEILYITLETGCNHSSPKHQDGMDEYIFVLEGELTVSLGGNTLTLKTGQALKFQANTEHKYSNLDDKICHFQNIIAYNTSN